ncbi:MAG: 4Fe-4S dicluster domain-containing protein [Candidatus Jordarchaeum sp.]|uniref:4Fe-4S dicluster domain-containing protein n=1 Tax=Candidatus Jordarchaeum sp. TaxID=2823881 RepID=UPI00404A7CF7
MTETNSSNKKQTVIKFQELDTSLREEISKIPGCDKLMLCFQCGTCSADCPIGRHLAEYKPRMIAIMTKLGMRNILFQGDLIWLCTQCYTCLERCPQDVELAEIISALRGIAVREGYLHPAFKKVIEALSNYGYIYEMTEFIEEEREMQELPPTPKVNIGEVRKIMRRTGLDKLVGMELGED